MTRLMDVLSVAMRMPINVKNAKIIPTRMSKMMINFLLTLFAIIIIVT